jgi:hypothetical protein
MDFKQFYGERELREFTGDGAIEKVASLAGKVVGGSLGLIGKAIKMGYQKSVNAITGDLKNKGTQAIAIAKIVYPYDSDSYAKMEKEGKLKDIKIIASFLTRKKEGGTATGEGGEKAVETGINPIEQFRSFGLTLVYESYAYAYMGLKGGLPEAKQSAAKLSMQSLKEAAEFESIRFQKFNKYNELMAFIDSNQSKPGSMLFRWISTASLFSKWKNKYDNIDNETEISIVSEIMKSGLSEKNASSIDEKMEEMEEKKIEVNIITLKDAFKQEIQDKIDEIVNEINADQTIIKKEGEETIDETEIKNFVSMSEIVKVPSANQNISNIFMTTKSLIKYNQLPLTVAGAFKSLPSFVSLFSRAVSSEEIKKLDNAKIRAMMQTYFMMNGIGLNKGAIKITEEYIKDKVGLKKLYVILTTGTTGKEPKPSPSKQAAQVKPEVKQA